MKEQLTLNDLCGYLPYGLKVMFEADEFQHELVGLVSWCDEVMVVSPFNDYGRSNIKNCKPIFRNLATDLTREIAHGNETFNPYDVLFNENPHDAERAHGLLIKNYGFKYVPYWIIEKLRFWHFWLGDQSFFEKGIILDYNDVNGL